MPTFKVWGNHCTEVSQCTAFASKRVVTDEPLLVFQRFSHTSSISLNYAQKNTCPSNVPEGCDTALKGEGSFKVETQADEVFLFSGLNHIVIHIS